MPPGAGSQPAAVMNGVPTPVLSPSPIATGFGFLPTPDRTYSPSKGNPAIRSLFPSVTQPNYIDPKCLAAVPGRPTDVLEFRPDLAKPLGLWEEATRVESAPPETWTALSPSDPYLFPRLTKNERDRLTTVWYYTRNLHDAAFLSRVSDTLDFIKEFVPFDAVLVGTMDRDMYTPLATRGFPLSCLPRRETFCSHTINQPGGSVLMLPNMPADPRFAQAPHVAQGGLISYSGTPLRYSFSRDDGVREEVMLGTLCGVSFSDPMSPNALQQRAMVHCADTIVREIVEHARNTRAGTRDKMASRLSSLADRANEGNAVNLVLAALQETYPKADVSFQNHDDSNITLIGVGPVPYADFEHHLYEDSAYIEAEILSDNHLPTSTVRNRTLRAVAVKCTSAADTYLVVQSAELPHIFDDVDAAFVYSCSLVVCSVRQAAELERATAARINFLRGISHELRTPIHALMSSCEMLAEDARAARTALSRQLGAAVQGPGEQAALLENALVSSRALMNTVNRLLNFDTLVTILPVPAPFTLAGLEAWLLDHANAELAERRSPVELVCEHLIPADVHVLNEDLDLLKQALCALLDNAITFTASGTITFRSSLHEGALVFDVIDTGHGIAPHAEEKIFLEFHKEHVGTPGAGLGLTVSRKIAQALGGDVELKQSGPNGSWFRMRINEPALAGQAGHPSRRITQNGAPLTCAVPSSHTSPATDTLRASLVAAGLEESSMKKASLLILEACHPQLGSVLAALCSHQVVLIIHRDEQEQAAATDEATASLLASRAVKVRAPVGAEAMWVALEAALDLRDRLPMSPPLSRASTSSSVELVHTRATLRILIVDDNQTNLNILCTYSRRRELAYVSALDGQLAVKAFQDAIVDGTPTTLVLMDLQMPVMDGAEATQQIRAHEAAHGLRPCLIYMVSGQSGGSDKQRCMDAGANGYYVKPLSLKTLDSLINLHFPR